MLPGHGGLPRDAVPAAFDVGARAYDRLVGANPGYHDHLRISARRMRLPGGGRGLRLLDAGCGTGASTAALLEAAPHAEIIAVDASAGMLAQAEGKAWPGSVRFVHTPIEGLTEAGVEGPFDGILAAYLGTMIHLIFDMNQPFRGDVSISPEAFEAIYARMNDD